MLEPLGHVASYLSYLLHRRRRNGDDATTVAQLAWPRARALPPGLSLTWLGTAGFSLAYQGHVLLLDPYLTRLSLTDLLRRRTITADERALGRHVERADAILVSHTHFDHALDVPALARRTGCQAYGSTSLARLMGLHGLEPQAIVVEPHRRYEVGPFRFHFVPSLHSKLVLGLAVPSGGELSCEHLDELTPQAYRCGQVFAMHIEVAGLRFYHQSSCDLLDKEIKDRGVDYFLCGISGRSFTPHYVERIVRLVDPAVIVPTHYDDFFRPLDAPAGFLPNVNVTQFAEEVHRAAPGVELRTLRLGETLSGPP